ncbi:MAG TPA: DnaJ C-terminal domain-containing protein [Geminicoccus sp.]|jgi:DnaJ-class molecular chaperone|uniref:DnaJ C-terminal domain-containing protein n=1 Tax=Geminicoccus sp. TaxID=2024832 RepID=UPI002E31130E|nr:DnaJ C-terminal domain-containing protein [Geminicoccus sp.]HEX2527106.1 DnaJ C-terminal domain-containing protein [Geminicoccus sp.]
MDPYQILGVAKDASAGDIRVAYRKLAKELHPDLNPGNKQAEERFKEVSAAYDLLSDAEKRSRFDRGEIDATGAERPQQRSYRHYADAGEGGRYSSSASFDDIEGLSDVFADLFGRSGRAGFRARGRDAHYRLDVDFLDAVNGAKRRITLPDGQVLDVTIPAGMRDGGILRLSGKGGPGIGGEPAGDALVEVHVGSHPYFKQEGDDIVMELPISMDEALLGAKVEVPTISGRVNMSIPRGASTGDTLRLKGKGVKPAGSPPGDQRVILKVVMPKQVDDDLAAFMEKWRAQHRYDPRAELRRGT